MNISCRIANADTQCGRITNPPERGTEIRKGTEKVNKSTSHRLTEHKNSPPAKHLTHRETRASAPSLVYCPPAKRYIKQRAETHNCQIFMIYFCVIAHL